MWRQQRRVGPKPLGTLLLHGPQAHLAPLGRQDLVSPSRPRRPPAHRQPDPEAAFPPQALLPIQPSKTLLTRGQGWSQAPEKQQSVARRSVLAAGCSFLSPVLLLGFPGPLSGESVWTLVVDNSLAQGLSGPHSHPVISQTWSRGSENGRACPITQLLGDHRVTE